MLGFSRDTVKVVALVIGVILVAWELHDQPFELYRARQLDVFGHRLLFGVTIALLPWLTWHKSFSIREIMYVTVLVSYLLAMQQLLRSWGVMQH